MSSKERRHNDRLSTPDNRTNIHFGPLSNDTSKNTDATTVTIKNISVSGICIVSEIPLELGQLLIFSDPEIAKTGTVVWTFDLKSEYTSGVQFND